MLGCACQWVAHCRASGAGRFPCCWRSWLLLLILLLEHADGCCRCPFTALLPLPTRCPLPSHQELDSLLGDDGLSDVPFLILGNKIDIPSAAPGACGDMEQRCRGRC